MRLKLEEQLRRLESHSALKHASVSFFLTDETGQILFEKNADAGLVPASCQKIITSISAFELLGKDFSYTTAIDFTKTGNDEAHVFFSGSGDPTLGSDRYLSTKPNVFLSSFSKEIKNAGIKRILSLHGSGTKNFSTQAIPNGWVWEDIGNYYGAGVAAINWRENQFDVILSSPDQPGTDVIIKGISPNYLKLDLMNECHAGRKGSGDNAYIYQGLHDKTGYIRGTIPAGENHFLIRGAVPDPVGYFFAAVTEFLQQNGLFEMLQTAASLPLDAARERLLEYRSPSFDSMNYWFLKKSINLYGEAFLKSIAYQTRGVANTDTGVVAIQRYWVLKGFEASALNIKDGSGLSPSNRVTTRILVQLLNFARKQTWFPSFYNSLPEINNIKMKDGYIGGVRSYTGYISSPKGNYSFAFIVNNFQGSASLVREQMWKVLDVLK